MALGGLALVYDSAAIVTPALPSDEIPGLSSYTDVIKASLAMLDSSIAVATSAAATDGAGGFPLPLDWINGNALSRDNFVRLVRTYKARFRAAVARTPAERQAADWNAIIADITNGITSDLVMTMSSSAPTWGTGYSADQMYVGGAWGMLTNLIYGMADTSGAYATFIGTAFDTRDGDFLIRTPDQRLPQGATRAAQQQETAALPLSGRRYLQNRPTGDDNPVAGYGFSQLDHRRWAATRLNSNNGPFNAINKIEMDMLLAEGHIRAGNFAAAATLIDASRARNSLPSIGAIANATQGIQGGVNACVPKVPQPPAFNTVACGSIWEAMKWEKRMETAFSCDFFCWYTDSRGWGDLVEKSNLEWPVPYQEMEARQSAYYSLGGGNARSAPKGTYGF